LERRFLEGHETTAQAHCVDVVIEANKIDESAYQTDCGKT
jgi:hypothetical protein